MASWKRAARSKTKEADLENILEEINEALASSVNQSKAGNGRWRAGQMRRGPAARRPFISLTMVRSLLFGSLFRYYIIN